jgi:alpha-mannosidase
VDPPDPIATGFKVAEDGEGWVVRLWECSGRTLEATVDASALGATQAWACDLLERVEQPLPMVAGKVVLGVPARGLRAVRFQ